MAQELLARWADAVVYDPGSLEVVRQLNVSNTDRIDAKRLIRALCARGRGESEEDDWNRLLNRVSAVGAQLRLSIRIRSLPLRRKCLVVRCCPGQAGDQISTGFAVDDGTSEWLNLGSRIIPLQYAEFWIAGPIASGNRTRRESSPRSIQLPMEFVTVQLSRRR